MKRASTPMPVTTTKTTIKPHVIGIDYSMTCPAMCYLGEAHATPKFFFMTDTPAWVTRAGLFPEITASLHGLTGDFIRRAIYVGHECIEWIDAYASHYHFSQPMQVAIEAYAFAAKGQVFHIGEHTGLFKYFYFQQVANRGWQPLRDVPPTVVKKFATGKGNAKKDQMVEAFLEAYTPAKAWVKAFFPKSTNIYQSPLADMADAYWIARWLQVQP